LASSFPPPLGTPMAIIPHLPKHPQSGTFFLGDASFLLERVFRGKRTARRRPLHVGGLTRGQWSDKSFVSSSFLFFFSSERFLFFFEQRYPTISSSGPLLIPLGSLFARSSPLLGVSKKHYKCPLNPPFVRNLVRDACSHTSFSNPPLSKERRHSLRLVFQSLGKKLLVSMGCPHFAVRFPPPTPFPRSFFLNRLDGPIPFFVSTDCP